MVRSWIVVLLWFSLLAILGLTVISSLGAPTDSDMRARFAERRQYLEGLMRSVRAESSGTTSDSPFGEPRSVDEELANVGALSAGFEGDDFYVVVYESGGEGDGTTKGFLFTERVPHPVVEDTDATASENEPNGMAHAFLDGGWYIRRTWSSP